MCKCVSYGEVWAQGEVWLCSIKEAPRDALGKEGPKSIFQASHRGARNSWKNGTVGCLDFVF